MIRVKVLDELLSDKYHNYTISDLVERVNEHLTECGIEPVKKRCIEKDLNFIESTLPGDQIILSVPGVRPNAQGRNYAVTFKRYENQNESIFAQKLTSDEKGLLRVAMSMLGQFDGLPELNGLDRLQSQLGVEEGRQIISLPVNIQEDSTTLAQLYTAIAHGQVILITYHAHGTPDVQKQALLHPQLLRQYNTRWYLFATADDSGKLLNFALDQIEAVEPQPGLKYIPYEIDLEERFGDIVGVTLHLDRQVRKIEFWVSDREKVFVETRPIHGSQTPIRGEKEEALREKYPKLQGGAFFRIECVENYELIRELCSYGGDLVVLSPEEIVASVKERATALFEAYK